VSEQRTDRTAPGPGLTQQPGHSSTVRLWVNGKAVGREVPNRATLAQFLRDDLGLTGTKISCELQVCGVCTVLVDGSPVSACTYLAASTDGKHVLTIEGLESGNRLHQLQEAFIEHFGLQCGFCTPGFIMMAKALLDSNPHPTEQDVVEHLDGNICRCTGYRPIVDAVLAVASRAGGKADVDD
jgi:aerobic-type carbon monoxide dehydrogenase small subunit (CoxS/CutS family)